MNFPADRVSAREGGVAWFKRSQVGCPPSPGNPEALRGAAASVRRAPRASAPVPLARTQGGLAL